MFRQNIFAQSAPYCRLPFYFYISFCLMTRNALWVKLGEQFTVPVCKCQGNTRLFRSLQVSDLGKEDSEDRTYTSRISHASSIACEVGGFSLARGQMSCEEKTQSV